MKLQSMFRDLWSNTPGKLGLVLFTVLTLISLYVVFSYPRNFGLDLWSNPSIWADNPKSVPPVWTNVFMRNKRPRHRVMELTEPTETSSSQQIYEKRYTMSFEYTADEPPTFLSLSLSNVVFARRSPVITTTFIRPDGSEIVLDRQVVAGPRRGEETPFRRHEEEPLRTVVGGDDRIVDTLVELYSSRYDQAVSREEVRSNLELALFGLPGTGVTNAETSGIGYSAGASGLTVLEGKYSLEILVLTNQEDDGIGTVKAVVGGSVYGIMGTDALGRDLIRGLLFGLPIALLIGISTAIVSTLMGMSLGLVSGYMGGRTDIVIQRAADIVANIPVLPLLIFLVFIGGSQLWLILMVLVAFSWPGLTIMVRSMVLQLRTGQEVEAARALGAGSGRIIFRHIFPHTASYILAQLVFFAPSAILAEAGLSFLGLGDPAIPTWGQILENGFRTGAVFLGYWWWIIPPGLLIVITAVTFMFLALGLEPVVDPRLRGKRAWHF